MGCRVIAQDGDRRWAGIDHLDGADGGGGVAAAVGNGVGNGVGTEGVGVDAVSDQDIGAQVAIQIVAGGGTGVSVGGACFMGSGVVTQDRYGGGDSIGGRQVRDCQVVPVLLTIVIGPKAEGAGRDTLGGSIDGLGLPGCGFRAAFSPDLGADLSLGAGIFDFDQEPVPGVGGRHHTSVGITGDIGAMGVDVESVVVVSPQAVVGVAVGVQAAEGDADTAPGIGDQHAAGVADGGQGLAAGAGEVAVDIAVRGDGAKNQIPIPVEEMEEAVIRGHAVVGSGVQPVRWAAAGSFALEVLSVNGRSWCALSRKSHDVPIRERGLAQ